MILEWENEQYQSKKILNAFIIMKILDFQYTFIYIYVYIKT